MTVSAGEHGMTVIEHLEELRSRLFKATIAFFLAAVVCWFFYGQIISLLISPLKALPEASQVVSGGKLIFTSPPEALFVRLKVTAFAAMVASLPVLLWQLWRFITPGLYKHEKRYALPFVAGSLLLFGLGAWLSALMLPRAIEVLVSLAGTDFVLVPRASEYLSFVLLLITAFGLTFEFPLLLIFLALAGVVTNKSLRRGRRYAWVAGLVVAAVVTPTQDPVTMLALAVPLGLLYEATILTVRLIGR